MSQMRLHTGFTPREGRLYFRTHTVELAARERYTVTDENGRTWVVMGYRKTAIRTSHTRCPMACEPSGLVVRKVLKSRHAGKQEFVWDFMDVPYDLRTEFLYLFPHFESFQEHDHHLQRLAWELVDQFESSPPNVARHFISLNPYWLPMRSAALSGCKVRIAAAKASRLEDSASLYADESFADYFGNLLDRAHTLERVIAQERIEDARRMQVRYEGLRQHIRDAHSKEDTRLEAEEAQGLKGHLDAFILEFRPHLPKVFGRVPTRPQGNQAL